jgi:hypothetical protein
MPLFYLDTSALVKRYRTEQGTEVVEQLLTNFSPEDRFFTSFLSKWPGTCSPPVRIRLDESLPRPLVRLPPGREVPCGRSDGLDGHSQWTAAPRGMCRRYSRGSKDIRGFGQDVRAEKA